MVPEVYQSRAQVERWRYVSATIPANDQDPAGRAHLTVSRFTAA